MSEPVLTVEQMRAAERAAVDASTSEWELMQRAGQGAANWVMRMAAGRPVTVLCGPGNNGGDGYVIASVLHRKGYAVKVIAPEEPGTETARKARSAFDGPVYAEADFDDAVIVDCLFGYGLSRPVEGEFAKILDDLAVSHCSKIAVDVPSAVASDDGEILGPLPQYDLTLALGAWKHAHFLMPSMTAMGVRRLVDIGLDCATGSAFLAQRPILAPPAADAHKYRRGLVAIVAGAMPGAPLLSAEAAMRSGAGYVKLFSDHSDPDAPAELVVEQGDLEDLVQDDRISAFLIGPGLGRDRQSRDRLALVLSAAKPTVIDADALHLLDRKLLNSRCLSETLVTPHEGELNALCENFGVSGRNKLCRAQNLHAASGLTVLAKGPDTVLASGGTTRFFQPGTSWLSTAGTGDVLAGIVASRLALHGDTMRAAEEGVWLHHEAARLASPAFSAGDLARAVKPAMASFL